MTETSESEEYPPCGAPGCDNPGTIGYGYAGMKRKGHYCPDHFQVAIDGQKTFD